MENKKNSLFVEANNEFKLGIVSLQTTKSY